MLARLLVVTGLVAAGLLLILVTTTTPAEAGAMGILAMFLLSYVTILCMMTFLIFGVALMFYRAGRELRFFRKKHQISLKKSYYYSSVVSLAPVIIVSLQSVGGVGIYELSLVALFIFLGCIYVARRVA